MYIYIYIDTNLIQHIYSTYYILKCMYIMIIMLSTRNMYIYIYIYIYIFLKIKKLKKKTIIICFMNFI